MSDIVLFEQTLKPDFESEISDYIKNLNISNSNKRKLENNQSAIIYTRCSSKMQTMNNSQSLQSQTSLCIDYCVQNDIKINDIVQDIYNGHDISKLKINSILANNSDILLVVAEPSRISRNVSNFMDCLTSSAKKNIIIHCVRDNLVSDTSTDVKKMLNLAYDSYIETQTLSKRLRSTFSTKKKYGSKLGRIPFGNTASYTTNEHLVKIRKFEPNETEQNIIKLINIMYFGCKNINEFYILFNNLVSNNEYKLKDSTNTELKQIFYGNFTMKTIAYFLNENNILNRNKQWTSISVNCILDKSEDFDINFY